MRKSKYRIGDIYNNRKIVDYKNSIFIVECVRCGKKAKTNTTTLTKASCTCVDEKKVQAMKEKYKNGVTIEHLKEWLGG